jgi:hypothetical protein
MKGCPFFLWNITPFKKKKKKKRKRKRKKGEAIPVTGFGPKRDKVTGDWRTLHKEEIHKFYSSPNVIRMIKSRRMRWAGHVARMWEKRNAYI